MRAKTSRVPWYFLSALILFSVSITQAQVERVPQPQQPVQQPSQPRPKTPEPAGEVGKFTGPGSCAASNCHGGVQPKAIVRIAQNEYSIWFAQDKHARAYTVLSNPTSVRMGKILGLEQPPNKSEKCLACHTLNAKSEQRAQTFQNLEDGVSCESCHGPAVGWLGPHTVNNWTHEQSLKLGMYDTRDLAKRTERCLTCHLGTPEKEVDHIMIAAGHPDLTFQLESFSSAMPRHWKPAPNTNAWASVQELAVGQAVQLREALVRLNRRASGPNWPEFAEYECFACHHSLTKPDASWRQEAGYHGRQPGAPVWNPATYSVFRHIAGAIDPTVTTQLVSELQSIERLSGKPANKDELATRAKEAAALADQIAREVQAQSYDRNLAAKLLREIADDSESISMGGERSAEQATMALASLALAYAKNEQETNQTDVRAAINELFLQLDNPSAYNAPRFAAKMQKVATLLPGKQASSASQ